MQGGWVAVGYYASAKFIPNGRKFSRSNLLERAAHLKLLDEVGHLGGECKDQPASRIRNLLGQAWESYRWRIAPENVFVFSPPVPIPSDIFNPGKQRMTVLYNLAERNDLAKRSFQAILDLARRSNAIIVADSISDSDERDDTVAIVEDPDFFEDPAETDFDAEEGQHVLRRHLRRERSRALLSAFRRSLKSFACSICKFDFEKQYGEIGHEFVECHHVRPISEMRSGEKTRLTDLVAVCANCHRMLHRHSPMLTLRELQSKLAHKEAV